MNAAIDAVTPDADNSSSKLRYPRLRRINRKLSGVTRA
jgi:hypothetical protein